MERYAHIKGLLKKLDVVINQSRDQHFSRLGKKVFKKMTVSCCGRRFDLSQ
jgi:hypothetical protein